MVTMTCWACPAAGERVAGATCSGRNMWVAKDFGRLLAAADSERSQACRRVVVNDSGTRNAGGDGRNLWLSGDFGGLARLHSRCTGLASDDASGVGFRQEGRSWVGVAVCAGDSHRAAEFWNELWNRSVNGAIAI